MYCKEENFQSCNRLLNTCSPDVIAGPIDQKFQAILIECTAEDQKRIRRRLAQLRSQMERAGKCIQPNYQWIDTSEQLTILVSLTFYFPIMQLS